MNAARLLHSLDSLRRSLASLASRGLPQAAGIDRVIVDLGAIQFHLAALPRRPIVVLLGGTGTGKSTLTNRLLRANDGELTASNFRRTFTAGPVAIVGKDDVLPPGWLALPHVAAASVPARGEEGRLMVIAHAGELVERVVLVDTPDVDGDQPAHHALADRAFRWAHAVVFVVSPEKYQMTELLPFFRLAQRYAVPSLFVMNKADDRAIVDDFEGQLAAGGYAGHRVFVEARDDSTYAPMPGHTLADLRDALTNLKLPESAAREAGVRRRVADVAARASDGVVEPLRTLRASTDAAVLALREMRAREAGIDVDPMTRQLRKRMQQRSILYLMGPQRMLERLRTAPAALARLPRSTFDVLRGKASDPDAPKPDSKVELPDFAAIVADQFAVAQERMADVFRANAVQATAAAADESAWRIDRAEASGIVEGEIVDLRTWLEARWNAHPRDTALIMKLVQKLPGGQRIARLSESAPYLVVIACGLNHFAFSGLDLLVIGGFSLATWLGEKLSDEVAQRTRQANRNIDARFAALVRRQADAAIDWLNLRIPARAELDALAAHLDDLRSLGAAEGSANPAALA